MAGTDLLLICALAFAGVFLLLACLAAVMRLIMAVFPKLEDKADTALLAAVASAAAAMYPGTRVTKIEETR